MENISFISRQHLTENQSVSEHSHRCWEVFFYNTCSGVSKIGNEEFPFRNNSFAVIPPDCPPQRTALRNRLADLCRIFHR